MCFAISICYHRILEIYAVATLRRVPGFGICIIYSDIEGPL